MKTRLSVLVLLIVFTVQLKAQEETENPKNVIKLSGAILIIPVGMTFSMDYERRVFSSKYVNLNAEGTFGRYAQIYSSNRTTRSATLWSVTSSVNALIGEKSHFFEVDAGARYSLVEKNLRNNIRTWLPIINMGYRYQHYQGKGLVFRAFIGVLGMGLSVGKSF